MKIRFVKVLYAVSLFCAIFLTRSRICHAWNENEPIGGVECYLLFSGAAGFTDSNGQGEVESLSSGIGMNLAGVVVAYDYTSFAWEQVNQLPFGDGKQEPWEQLHRLNLGFDHSDMLNGHWGYFLYIGGVSRFEKEMNESYGAEGFAGLIYRIPSWRLGIRLGGGANYSPVKIEPFPIVSLDWNTSAQSGFHGAIGFPTTKIGYRFSPKASMSLDFDFGETDVYRLADNSSVKEKGYLETEGCRAVLSGTCSPIPRCSISVGGGVGFEKEFSIYDENGDNRKTHGLKDNPGGFANIVFEF